MFVLGGFFGLCDGVCSLCGSRENRVLFDEEFRVVVCRGCGLVFVADDCRDLFRYYSVEYDFKLMVVRVGVERVPLFPENVEHDRSVVSWLRSVCELGGKRVLEIGCHAGFLLKRVAGEGAEVVGIEPNAEAVAFAGWANRLSNIHCCMFEDFEGEGPFDVVLLINTLEHMVDPVRILLKVGELLGENGLLFIEVPNFFSPFDGFYRGMGNGCRPSRDHLFIFSKGTMRALLDRTGFRVRSINGVSTIRAVASKKCGGVGQGVDCEEFRRVVAMYYFHRAIKLFSDVLRGIKRCLNICGLFL